MPDFEVTVFKLCHPIRDLSYFCTNTNFVFCDLLTTTLPRHIPTRVTTANGAALTSLRAIIRDFPKNAKIKGCSKWWMSLL